MHTPIHSCIVLEVLFRRGTRSLYSCVRRAVIAHSGAKSTCIMQCTSCIRARLGSFKALGNSGDCKRTLSQLHAIPVLLVSHWSISRSRYIVSETRLDHVG